MSAPTLEWANDAALKELLKQPCQCVTCGTCNGSGRTLYFDSRTGMDDLETCMDCDGYGVTEECDRCLEIEELEHS